MRTLPVLFYSITYKQIKHGHILLRLQRVRDTTPSLHFCKIAFLEDIGLHIMEYRFIINVSAKDRATRPYTYFGSETG
jgi:hypothetical protein